VGCALTKSGSLACAGGVRPDREDRERGDRGADRALEPAWVAGDRAHRVGAFPSRGGGVKDCRPAAAARQPGHPGPRRRSAGRWRGADRIESGQASVGGAEHRLPGAGTRPGLQARRGVQVVDAGSGDRTDEQAGLDPGVDRGRDRRTVVSHDQAAAAGLCDTAVARCPRLSVRGACRVGAGDVGALRRDHVVLRDR
jgi:hypothetical protein